MARRPVLLVGDDHMLAGLLREYFHLHHADDYEIESVDYCEDALTTLQSRPFALVLLLSLRVPWRTWPSLRSPSRHIGDESAILFLKQMRALKNPVPVALLTAWDMEAEALDNGAVAVIPKPFTFTELGHHMDTLLRPSDQD